MSAILVPLDGSALARRAMPFATAIAQRSNRPLLLLRAISTLASPTLSAASEVTRAAAAEIEAEAERPRADGLTVETLVVEDEASSAILDTVAARQAGLIVMSTHGRGGLGRWLYGSVADSVLRHATVPVLLVPPVGVASWPPDRPMTILVPLDGSELSEAALGAACELADMFGGALYLVRSIPFSQYVAYADGYVLSDTDTTEHELAEAGRYLDEVAARVRTPQRSVEVRATYGSPFLDVAAVAHEVGAGLIAMATHGRGGLSRAILGSVTTVTVRRADVPLLLVRPAVAEQTVGQAAETNGADRPAAAAAAPGPTVALDVSADELELLVRAVADRLHDQPVDSRHAEPARLLLDKLRTARAVSGTSPSARHRELAPLLLR